MVQELKPLADEKGIELAIKTGDRNNLIEPVTEANIGDHRESYNVKGDVIEIRRLLTNILGNAIKFTDSGMITVELSTRIANEWNASGHVELVDVAIADTGPGIEPEAQEKIFEWFFQGEHMKAGSGLGLHLSKRIAELHKGNLTLESEVGKGSTFTLSLPRLTG